MGNYQSNNCGYQSENYQMENGCSNCSGSCGSARRLACMCSMKVICLFVLLFAFALGLILGAVFAPFMLFALAAIIVFAIIMAIAIIALLIFRRCENCD